MITWYKKSNACLKKNKVLLLQSGEPYFSLLLKLINGATNSIHLQVYIFENDNTGKTIADALMAAAKRGVQVFIVVDGYASRSLPKEWILEMKASGIYFRFFAPLLKSKNFYFGRRMHHKVFVADAQHCLVGGINIGDRYNDTKENKAWLDFALYTEGETATALCNFSLTTWKKKWRNSIVSNCNPLLPFSYHKNEYSDVRIRRNDWVKNKNDISASYKQLLKTAQHEVIICCSYFLPGIIIRNVIEETVKRGVKIKVITAGKTDVAISKYAERWLYDWMLRNNIDLYEYQPTVLHAKVGISDEKWLTIGSYNVNQISAYASVELNLDVHNPHFVHKAKRKLEEIIEKDCLHITMDNYKRSKNIFIQFGHWCSYQFIKVAVALFTFYFKRQ